ncbi:MAG: tetratricopeptide repeat protein, partial [Candidatus Latescibacteria bacterium]|nr:tetratricopeptide repeat protein [Candidatus Latescibacterota bacterium]
MRYLGWPTTVVAVLILSGCGELHWRDPVATKVAAGNRAFAEGDFDQAQLAYQDAMLDADEDLPEIQFNLGDVLFTNRKPDEARGSFDRAIAGGSLPLQAMANYNIGNALFHEDKWTEAIEAYQRALELDPTDEDAKYNLELLLAKLAEQADKAEQGDGEKTDTPKASDWAKRRAARAEMLAKEGHFTEAALIMSRTLEAEPNAAGELGDFSERLDQLQTIMDEIPPQPGAFPQADALVDVSAKTYATWRYGSQHYEHALN